MQRFDADAPIRIRLRKFGCELRGDSRHLRLCLLDRNTVFQPAHYEHEMRLVIGDVFGPERERYPQLHWQTIVHPRRKHTDDLVWITVHADLFADDGWVGSELLTPHSIAEYDDAISAGLTFFRKEIAAEHHRQSFHFEEPRRAW